MDPATTQHIRTAHDELKAVLQAEEEGRISLDHMDYSKVQDAFLCLKELLPKKVDQ